MKKDINIVQLQHEQILWHYDDSAEDLLFDSDTNWAYLISQPQSPITIKNQQLYIKVWQAKDKIENLKWNLLGLPAKKAFSTLINLMQADQPIVKPIAWAHHKQYCFIVYLWPEDIIDLDTLIEQQSSLTSNQKDAMLSLAGKTLAQAHHQGLIVPGIKPENIYLSQPIQKQSQCYLVDLQKLKLDKQIKRISKIEDFSKSQFKNMAELLADLQMQLDGPLCRFFVKGYLAGIEQWKMWTENEVDKYLNLLKNYTKRYKKTLKLEKIAKKEFQKILIIKPSSLGDIVRTIPILSGLRKKYPQAHISWMVRPEFKALLANNPDLDEIIEFNRKLYGKMGYNWKATKAFSKFCQQLKEKKFDLVLDIQGLFRSGFLSWLSGGPTRIGFDNAREFGHIFYTHKLAVPKKQHSVLDYWLFAEVFGFDKEPMDFKIVIDELQRTNSEALLKKNGLKTDKYMVFVPGGTAAAKRWSPEKFAELANEILKMYGKDEISIVLAGAGQEEQAIAEEIQAKCQFELVDMVSKTTLEEMTAIISQSTMVIGNDSGPLHIASAMNIKTVGIYGPTNPAVVGPWGQLDNIVVAGGQMMRKQRYSKLPEHNIENISVDEVLEKVKKISEK